MKKIIITTNGIAINTDCIAELAIYDHYQHGSDEDYKSQYSIKAVMNRGSASEPECIFIMTKTTTRKDITSEFDRIIDFLVSTKAGPLLDLRKYNE